MKESELHTRAVLVRFRSRYWDGTITDRAITQKTNRELEMRRDQGKYRKQIFCRDDLEKLRKAYSEIKQYYYERTLPWEDRGPRLLATSAFETFTVYMNRGINTYQELVQDIPGQYQTWVENARTALGRAWNPADYPAISTVMRKFHAGLQFFTIPNVEDLRINLAEDQKKMLQEQMEEGTRSMFQKAMKDCWQRMYEVVDRMVESLEAYPQRTFKDSLVGNIERLVEILPSLNLADDPELERMRARISTQLTVWTPDQLRQQPRIRADVAALGRELKKEIDQRMRLPEEDEVEEILAKMGGIV